MTESATGPLKHLGTIVPPEHLHNIAWVNAEGRTLCMCAKTGLYRVRLNIPASDRKESTPVMHLVRARQSKSRRYPWLQRSRQTTGPNELQTHRAGRTRRER